MAINAASVWALGASPGDMRDASRTSHRYVAALAISLTVHATVGTFLVVGWQRPLKVEPPPLTVTFLEKPRASRAPAIARPAPKPAAAPVRSTQREPALQKRRAPSASLTAAPDRVPLIVPEAPAIAALAVVAPDSPLRSAPETSAQSAPVSKGPAASPPVIRDDPIALSRSNAAYLNNPRPIYPFAARRLGVEGTVVLRVHVSAGGAPQQVQLFRSSGSALLDEAALKAVKGWTFVPAREGTTPISHWVEVPINFQLRN